MKTDCLFCKIIQGDIPTESVYEDDLVIAFNDIHPQAPIHQLIIPKKHIATLNDLEPDDNKLMGHMIQIAKELANRNNIAEDGYRILMNCNAAGGQAVYHIHLHLLGGRYMHWPPG